MWDNLEVYNIFKVHIYNVSEMSEPFKYRLFCSLDIIVWCFLRTSFGTAFGAHVVDLGALSCFCFSVWRFARVSINASSATTRMTSSHDEAAPQGCSGWWKLHALSCPKILCWYEWHRGNRSLPDRRGVDSFAGLCDARSWRRFVCVNSFFCIFHGVPLSRARFGVRVISWYLESSWEAYWSKRAHF